MKTKTFDNKGKKRSHSESSFPTKPYQKQKGDGNKNAKKVKLTNSAENGNFTAKNTVQFSKQVDKQGKKKDKDVKQSVELAKIVKKVHVKELKSTNVEPDVKIFNKKGEKKEKLGNQKKESLTKELNKEKQTQKPQVLSIAQTIEGIKKKMEEIRSREVISKSAKRKLGALKKRLMMEEAKNNLNNLDTTEKKTNKQEKHQDTDISVKNKEKINKDKKELGKKNEKAKVEPENDQDDFESDDDDSGEELSMDNLQEMTSEDESDEDEKEEVENTEDDENSEDDEDVEEEEEEEGVQNKMDIQDDDSEDEDLEDEDDLEDEEVEKVEDEESEDDEDEESEDDEDEESTDKDESIVKVTEKKEKKDVQFSDHQKKEDAKKKRYVLYVNNVPYDTTSYELKQHFLTKVKSVVSVRIPTDSNGKSRGFAYVEFQDHSDYMKGLELNHSFIKKRRINVQCAVLSSKDKETDALKKVAVVKTKKLHALQKTGKGGFQDKRTQKKKFSKAQ